MPPFTRFRAAVIVLSLSLFSIVWIFGLPQQVGQPPVPIIDHYDHSHIHTEPIIPAPIIEETSTSAPAPKPSRVVHGERPVAEEEDHRWDDGKGKGGNLESGTTLAEAAATSGLGHDEDNGRWDDKTTDATRSPKNPAIAPTARPSAFNVTNSNSTASSKHPASTIRPVTKFCKDVRGAPHVMVVVRTSKAEIEKLSPHLLGLLSCVPNFAIFSDHSGEYQGHKIHNALESISSETRRAHEEFKEYQIMRADPGHKLDAKRTKDLDKWKFLPMVYKSFMLRPSAKFFLFIEADTSVSWTNLLQWVTRLDYRIPYYSGAPTFMNSMQLAQRGSGILLSQGALRLYSKTYDEQYASKWEKIVGKECCGDLALAMALSDSHVELYSGWPLLQGEHPSTLDYTLKQWCVPAVTWHHVPGDELRDIWALERNWTHTFGWDTPYLFRDAFHEFVQPHIEAQKLDWDNLSQDTKIVAPQGRRQKMKEDEERSRKEQEEEAEQKVKEEQMQKAAAERKQKELESLEFQTADMEEEEESSLDKRKRDSKEGPDWDKLAETFQDAGDSPEQCQRACEGVEDCLQWRYTSDGDGECHLGKVMRLGKKAEEGKAWTSGWLIDRIQKVTSEGEWECTEVRWKFYQ